MRKRPGAITESSADGATSVAPTAQTPTATTEVAPVSPDAENAKNADLSLVRLKAERQGCTHCKLCEKRTKVVYGTGAATTRLVFVGEGPGEQEDLSGEPFVGKAGELLTRMIQAMGLSREQVYICNVVKCRPPGNRNPEPDEIAACSPFLFEQLDLIKPAVVVALGKFAAQTLLQTDTPITRLRGKFYDYRDGAKLMPTFHPAYLLRNPESKREAWEDLKQVAKALDLTLPRG